MSIEELIRQAPAQDVITELKSRRLTPLPDTQHASKALDPKLHDINDPLLRPDKRIKIDQGEEAQHNRILDLEEERSSYRIERVARIAVAIQKLIINRAVSFTMGNPVCYNATPQGKQEEQVVRALRGILYDNKSNSLNRRVARSIFSHKECAELWYVQQREDQHLRYGFPTRLQVRCALFSPALGDTLYPYYDETGDMVAFSRAFSRTDAQKKRTDYFETYTASEHWLWTNGQNGYECVPGYPKPVAIGKIPVIYGRQDHFETEDVDGLIDRLEKLLSNFADTNDYHASPKIFVTGQINGWSKKGESGAVIEGEEGASMQYVSWQNAPESVKLEIETLLKLIYTITQTPDISFESVKGLGATSGVALKLLFMDAHLKVQDKREIFDDYLQRRVNVLKAYIALCSPPLEVHCQALEIEPEITPYTLTNELDQINMWLAANGNKPLVSQRASVKGAALTQNPEEDLEQLESEAQRDQSFTLGEPVVEA